MKFSFKKQKQNARNPGQPAQNSVVFSYYANRSRDDQSTGRYIETVEVKRHAWWRLIPSYIAVILLISSGVYLLSLQSNPRMVVASNSSVTILQDMNVYRDFVRRELQSSIFNRTKLSIDPRALERKLLSSYPEIAQASVTIPLTGRRPLIEITPAEPALYLSVSRGDSYVVSQNGVILVNERDIPQAILSNLPRVSETAALKVEPGKQALPKDTVQFILQIEKQLAAQNMVAAEYALPAIANELHVRVGNGGPYYVKFDIQGDPRLQAGSFVATKKKLDAEKVVPTEYIDVRVSGKVFYR